MKSKPLVIILFALALSDCEKKNAEIRSKFPIIEKTAKDAAQPGYIRESAATFEEILKGNKVYIDDWIRAHGDMMEIRNEVTISTFVAFLKFLEHRVPKNLPSVEEYEAMKERGNKSEMIEDNVGWTIALMGESIKEISLYNDPKADAEIEGILKRFREEHSTSETGKKILNFFNMVHEQGLEERATGTKPWETPRRPPVYFPRSKKP